MNKYIIGIIMLFLVFVVFTSTNIIVGADGEPNYVEIKLDNVYTDDTVVTDYVEINQQRGKMSFYGVVYNDDLDIGVNYITIPIKIYYDIYSTGNDADVLIYETTATAVAERPFNTLNLTVVGDIVITIPYSVEYLFTSVSRGYSAILDALTTEFRQGFPTLPSGDADVLDYVVYIGRGLFHSVTSVAITFDFIVFPINIMRGSFI